MNDTNENSRDSGERSPDELKRKGDAIRADLDRTLDALERRLSPRELANRGVTYLREHSSQVVDKIGDTMRQHPVTALLSAAALAFAATSIMHMRREGSSESDNHDYDDERSYAGESARHIWRRARNHAQTTAEIMREQVDASLDSARDHIADTRGQLGSFVRQQPLVVGLLAATVGALIGAALPVSEPEKRLMRRSGAR